MKIWNWIFIFFSLLSQKCSQYETKSDTSLPTYAFTTIILDIVFNFISKSLKLENINFIHSHCNLFLSISYTPTIILKAEKIYNSIFN